MEQARLVGAGTYAALEGAFAGDLAAACQGAAGRAWVLAPTNLLTLHLRRVAARERGGVIGVEFLTLRDAARRMALPRLAREGRRRLPAGGVELAARRLLDDVAEGSYLWSLRAFANGAPAVARAVRTLEDCLWTPRALQEAAPAAAPADPSAPSRLRELAALWAELRRWKEERRLFEDDDLIAEAARQDAAPAEAPQALLVYGFYDLNPAQRALVGRLIGLAERSAAYLLWGELEGRPAAGFEYALPTVQWLKEALGADEMAPAGGEGPGGDLGRLVGAVFSEHPVRPPQETRASLMAGGAFDGSVRVLSCPGEVPQAVEVAREALRVAAGGEGRRSVGVLLRSAEGAAGLLVEAMDRAGVRCYVREGLPLAETVAGRVALSLLALAMGDAERTDVIDFLGLAELRWPADLTATALDRVSREAGILRGRAGWEARLGRRAERLAREAGRAEDESERRLLARDAELCRAAAGFLREFFARVDVLSRPATWAEAAAELGRLVEAYSPADDPGTAPVLEAIAELGRLDVAELPATPERLRWALGRRLARASLRRERFEHVGVTAGSIMGARGATFDVVVLPGLVEKGFPRHAVRHSLLSEPDREALSRVAAGHGCGPLPLQRDRPAEERYLFRLGLGSARRGVVLAYPRIEPDTGRPRVASHFLTDACSALAGFSIGAQMLDDGLPVGLVRRVPMGRTAGPEAALDARQYDAAVFAGGDGPARVAYLTGVSEEFARAVRMDELRWRRRDFGPYDGKLRCEDLLGRLRERYSRFAAPISPTRLETYARCPFEYFLTYVLDIAEVEAPAEQFELAPMDRGALVHDLLRTVYAEHLSGRRLGELSDEDAEALLAAAGPVLDGLGRVHAATYPATWAAQRERALRELRALLAHERAAHAEAAPARFECEFGIGEPALVMPLAEGEGVSFRGRMDRLDELPEGAVQVVDYKTGRPTGYRAESFRGGTQLQLPVYLLAAAELTGAEAGRALYLMTSGPRDVAGYDLATLRARMDDLRRALRLIVEGIAAGDFFLLPAEDAQGACGRFCRYRDVCGAARRTLAEIKQTDPEAGRLAELRAIE